MREMIYIQALKHPDIPHYEWEGELISKTNDYVLILCKPGRKLKHHTKGTTFTINNTSLEFFSLKEWFTVAMEIEYGKITSYYCNIAQPSTMQNQTLCFVDLDLDLIKKEHTDWQIIDEIEFDINSVKYNYSSKLKEKVSNKEFPFNENILDGIFF